MSIRSQGNPTIKYASVWSKTGKGAVGDGAPFRANTGDGGYAGSPHGGAPGIVMIRYKFQ